MSHRVAIVGTGYVGLVCGACFAELGHSVVCTDVDAAKLDRIGRGDLPIYEPGLAEMVEKNRRAGRLTLNSGTEEAIRQADAVFVAVPTPSDPATGRADLRAVFSVVETVAAAANRPTVLVIKSTVPCGTIGRIEERLAALGCQGHIKVASNPEFLREGNAILDFVEAERVVVGSRDAAAVELLRSLHRPLLDRGTRFVSTNPETAELIKSACNAFLATKVAYINEMARLCDRMGADVETLAFSMGLDRRIGPDFLRPGPGFGGSCFPKDAVALAAAARDAGEPLGIVEAVSSSNRRHIDAMADLILSAVGNAQGKRIGILGLAFKARTDDVREAPALQICARLTQAGAQVSAYDPKAVGNALRVRPDLDCRGSAGAVAEQADALVVLTDWAEFATLDLSALARVMRRRVLIDLRNIIDPEAARLAGLQLLSLGRRHLWQALPEPAAMAAGDD